MRGMKVRIIIICFGHRTRCGTFFTEKYYKSKSAAYLSVTSASSSLDLYFSIKLGVEIKKNSFSVQSLYHKDSTTPRPLNKVKPCSVGLVLEWVTKYECPV